MPDLLHLNIMAGVPRYFYTIIKYLTYCNCLTTLFFIKSILNLYHDNRYGKTLSQSCTVLKYDTEQTTHGQTLDI